MQFDWPGAYGWRLAVVELVRTAIATFEASYVRFFRVHVDVAELDQAKLADPQAVPEHQKQHAMVPDRVTRSVLARNEKFIDFVLSKIFPAPGFSK